MTFVKVNISYGDHDIKQHYTVKYSGCHVDFNLSDESMAMAFFEKGNEEIRLSYQQSKSLKPSFEKITV